MEMEVQKSPLPYQGEKKGRVVERSFSNGVQEARRISSLSMLDVWSTNMVSVTWFLDVHFLIGEIVIGMVVRARMVQSG